MKNFAILVLSMAVGFLAVVAMLQREYIGRQDVRIARLAGGWDRVSASTDEWSICWSNGCSHPVSVIHYQGSRITDEWVLGGGIVTNIFQVLPVSQYPRSAWCAPYMVHPHDPWGDWLLMQVRTNLIDGQAEARVVYKP